MLRGEATNTNFIIFGVTRQGLKPTRSKQTNHYTNDAVNKIMSITGYADLINNILKKVKDFYCNFFFSGFVLLYLTYDWANARNNRNLRKKPGQYDNDV